ncbi:UBX domain-containing protein 7 [Teleopsis dalmanni]|uniref:UBX domain-containing protein 7 n=1 Tax=Teleopsis dalmanni TaxID=139649 RepID=UPI0018CEAC2D|nr:UBX domain-containing protein 7 [Teleopsis dalmanni]
MSDSQISKVIENLVEVAGITTSQAKLLLEACGNNLEAAISLHFEGGGIDALQTNNDASVEDDVRPPIPPRREQLCRPEDDNFLLLQPQTRRANTRSQVKVCPLRDFAREGALMEQELNETANSLSEPFDNVAYAMETNDDSSPSVNTRKRRRERNAPLSSSTANSRLGDLYRPPTDITFAGTFQVARTTATDMKLWLLVNIQSDNFASQLLNRDVWSDKIMRSIIKKKFLLWQVDAEAYEGRRFCAFYHCTEQPYVCVVDPRTGEEMWKSRDPKHSSLIKDLKEFLIHNKTLAEQMEDDFPSTSKRSRKSSVNGRNGEISKKPATTASTITKAPSTKKNSSNVTELTEKEQIALAIRNSMKVNNDDVIDDDEVNNLYKMDTCVDDSVVNSFKSYERYLGVEENDLTRIKLRLWNKEENDEVVELRWPSDTQLNVLRIYIEQIYKHIPPTAYRIICAYPRKTFENEHFQKSLKQLGLHPTVNLHVTVD